MCVSTYLPFQTTYYLNGHHFIEIELRRQAVAFRKDDNAFLTTSDPKALQAAADQLTAAIIEERLNYWSWLLGPKFSQKDRKAVNLDRKYSINQIESAATSSSSATSPSTGSLSAAVKSACGA